MIQGSINQLLSMSAVFARMDPNVEQRTQLRQKEKQMEGLKKQAEAIDNSNSNLQEKSEAEIAFENRLADQIVETSEERFQLKPTEETLTAHKGNIKGAEEFKAAGQQELDRRAAAQRAEADRMAAEELRQKELEKVRASLLANAPVPRGGIKREYK
jgi:hypothetical protein